MNSWDCEKPDIDYTLHLTLIIICSVGIMGNFTIKLVLLWKGDKSVVNTLLIMLAVFDNLFLVCRLGEVVSVWGRGTTVIKDPGYVWRSIGCDVYRDWGLPDGYCHQMVDWDTLDYYGTYLPTLTSYTLYTLSSIFKLASVYHTVIIAVFRFIAIISPFKALTLCTGRRAIFAGVISFIICICVHVPRIIFIPVYQKFRSCYSDTLSGDSNVTCLSLLSDYLFYKYFFQGYQTIFYYHLIFCALPCTALVILIIILLIGLWRSSSAQTNDATEEENKAVDKVIVVMVTVFLVTYIVKALYLTDILYFEGHIINSFVDISCTAYFIVSTLAFVVPTLKSVVNIFIYLWFRKSFRTQFMSVF